MSTFTTDLETFERALIRQALDRCGCDVRATARHFGIPHATNSRVTTLRETLISVERARVIEALRETGGDVKRAAALLGMPRRSLYNRMRRDLSINPDDYRNAKIAQ